MVVVYNADERFACVFATSVVSLFENNRDAEDITVYLIENHVSDESKAKFQKLASEYGRTIITLPMPDLEKTAGVEVVIPGYNRMATCGRLFIASLLPENVNKVIYADCDTIFEGSISELWETDITGYSVGMTDCAQNSSFRTQLGLSEDGIYFNSGLLLINLEKWRREKAEDRFIDFIRSQGGYVPFPDEGVLNAVFDGDILLLPLRFNVITQVYAFTYEQLIYTRGIKSFYTPEEVKSAKENPIMVHFTSNFYYAVRPWEKGCEHPYTGRYLEYRAKTPWKDIPLWEDSLPTSKKIYSRFCHLVPKPISLWTARVITLYMTPAKHRRNKRRCQELYEAETANIINKKSQRGGGSRGH